MNFVADGLYVEHGSFVGGWFFSGFRFFVAFKFAHKRAWLANYLRNDRRFFEHSHLILTFGRSKVILLSATKSELLRPRRLAWSRTPAFQAGGRGFKSRRGHFCFLAPCAKIKAVTLEWTLLRNFKCL